MSMFDLDDLANVEVNGSMETAIQPVPIGEHPAYIKKYEARTGVSKNGNEYVVLDVTWAVTSPQVAEELGIDEPTVRQSLFLDLDDNGMLALGKGKNIQLGRLREALGQNGPGPWNFGRLEGASAIIKVGHRQYEDRTFAEVNGVAAA